MILNPIIPVWIMILFLPLFWICRSGDKKQLIRQMIMICLIFLVNLRPMLLSDRAETLTNDLDVLFVIDTTISMLAEDYNNGIPRLNGVKEDCLKIMDELEGAKFSIISFDNSSEVNIPYTRDMDIIKESLDILTTPVSYYARGSSMNVPIEDIERQLESSNKDSERARIIFFFSDGEITNKESLDTFEYSQLGNYISDGAVLGYGTSAGGAMRVKNPYSEKYEYLKDTSTYPNTTAMSVIDEDTLEEIADCLDIEYLNVNTSKEDLTAKLNDIKAGVRASINSIDKSSFDDTYFIFVIPLLGLLVYEFIYFRRGV